MSLRDTVLGAVCGMALVLGIAFVRRWWSDEEPTALSSAAGSSSPVGLTSAAMSSDRFAPPPPETASLRALPPGHPPVPERVQDPIAVTPPASALLTRARPNAATEPSQDRPERVANGVQPHPLDQSRRAMAERRHLWREVRGAIDAGEFATARRWLRTYDSSHTDGRDEDMREGFERILECREAPSDAARKKGQRFVDEQRGSRLRRWVRRACLEQR